ncbi:CocE/NonD family hydrolase [Neochlamydia sp. S13]|uniref:CocE/NonD family hydrolase n=1 Tax=Neochlamydia sp. S13 TaxID=1353976 RepID=UPI0005A796D7|nr:CocE/NonD family hydrolase [Neochlamydia sp. S13]BBI18049.1 Putative acylase and diesterase [Neochlamydia sp. S13]
MHLKILTIFFLLSTSLCWAKDNFVADLTVKIPMRDGYELPADIYFPADGREKKAPCILLRCPAGRKAMPWVGYTSLTHFGYVVVMQDTRNALDINGKTAPFITDGWGALQDGYDTVEWLAKSPYTNGKIGTLGFSAVGCTQLLLAPSAPPSLKCQYIGIAAGSLYHHAIFPGGQLHKNQVEGWLGYYSKDTGVLSFVSSQPFYNAFWEELDSIKVAQKVRVPGFLYGGWYDTFLQGTIDAFVSRQNHGGKGALGKQKLLIGPWTHWWPISSKLGDFPVPPQGFSPSYDMSPQRWFDYHLKGIENGVDQLPPVTYYVMGPFDGSPSKGNVWKTAENWPIPAKNKAFYLGQSHKLMTEITKEKRVVYSFNADPKNPVPTIGGRNLFLDCGPRDQRAIESRSDVLVFTTEPLEEDLEVTGHLLAKLYVTSNASDTDFVVRLSDVYPDGRSILISDGIHRTAIQSPQLKRWASWQKPYEIEIDLASTSMVFAKGHCIRVSICGSNFPRYEVNHNVGLLEMASGRCAIARNKIYTGPAYPSRLILPLVE